jgi:putative transposase
VGQSLRIAIVPQAMVTDTAAKRSLITYLRSSRPSRRVGDGCSNVCVRYPSKKMGVTVQFENHRFELAGLYEMEHDPSTLGGAAER